MKFAVVASAMAEDPRVAPQRARVTGFHGLDFSAFTPQLNIPDLSASGRREFRHLLSSQEQQLACISVDLNGHGFGPGADIDRTLNRLDRILEAAAALAAPLVCVDLGPLPAVPKTKKPKPAITPDQAGVIILPTFTAAPAPEATSLPAIPSQVDPNFVAQVDAAMADLGRRADRYSVTVAFRSELAAFDALEQILTRARCPWFGVDLDTVSMLRDEWEPDEIFSRLGSLIRHVRAKDALIGADKRTKPVVIGQGKVNWEHTLSNLDDAGYRGWITIDPLELPDRSSAALQALNYLRKLRD